MRRLIYIFTTLAALLAVSCKPADLLQFSVSPETLEFSGEAGTQTVMVTADDLWVLKVEASASWLTVSKVYGRSSEAIEVSVTENTPKERQAALVFTSGDQSATLTVKQAPGDAELIVDKGEHYPDPASGIDVDPMCPDADQPCTIKFATYARSIISFCLS